MVYHYCRVSSKGQSLERQIVALERYKHADRVFSDKQSGKNFDRADYDEMRRIVKPGDEIVVKELDRLGRNKECIKDELKYFSQNGVKVRILDVPTTLNDYPGQEWVQDMLNNVLIEVLGAIAEQERIKIKKRQSEGISAMPIVDGKRVSKKTGRGFGRETISTPNFSHYLTLHRTGELSVQECCDALGISRATWYNRVKQYDSAS